MIGKAKRLNRLLNRESGNIVLTPMDHGITMGPIKGLDRMERTLPELVGGGSDTIVLHKGMVAHYSDYLADANLGLMMHLSTSTILSPGSNQKVITGSVHDAVIMGCDGVSVHINLGVDSEPEMLKDVSLISSDCVLMGMPLLVMIYVKEHESTPERTSHAVRVALELGADLIKINYTGDKSSFRDIVRTCSVPILVAGREKVNNDSEILQMISDAMDAGARGVAIGRNVFQNDDIGDILGRIRSIVHLGERNV